MRLTLLLLVGLSRLLAADAARDARWREDLDTLTTQLPALHPNLFFQTPRSEFDRAAADLRAAIPDLNDAEVMVGLARITALPGEIDQQQQESKQPAPFEYKLIREVDELLNTPHGKAKLRALRECVYKRLPDRTHGQRRMKFTEVLQPQPLKELDVVVSSFGKHPFELKRNAESSGSRKHVGGVITKMLHEAVGKKFEDEPITESTPTEIQPEPYYRRWVR